MENKNFCPECGDEMIAIGYVGTKVSTTSRIDGRMTITGQREQKLYQCVKDKTVKIN